MKKSILATLLALAFASAYADNDCRGNCSNDGGGVVTNNNNPVAHGGNGTGVGIAGASSNATATGGNSSNSNRNDNSNANLNAQGQLQNATSVANSGGNKLNGGKQNTTVNVGGDTYERSAPAVFAGNIPQVAKSCRLYMFGGGSNTSGAASGSIPLGNDQTCLSGAKVDYMTVANKLFPGAFGKEAFVKTICKVEGMDEVAECQASANNTQAQATPAAAPAVTRPAPAVTAQATPDAALVQAHNSRFSPATIAAAKQSLGLAQ